MISIGFLPRSETGISCSLSTKFSILSSVSRISIAFFLASRTAIPDKEAPNSVILPSKSIA